MDFYLIQFIKTLMLPPGNILLLFIGCIFLLKISKTLTKRLLIFSCAFFYLMSMPLVATSFIDTLEDYPALTQMDFSAHNAQAIVILGGGRRYNPEYEGGDDVSMGTLERLRYGAYLQSKTQLPILVTGGFIRSDDIPEGVLMEKSLSRDFKVSAKWQESRSRNTAENAIYSREILSKENIDTIFLVTKAWHLPRAVEIFKEQGFTVIPAPTGFDGHSPKKAGIGFYDFMPSSSAIRTNAYAIHEILGRAWYFIRY